MPTVPALEKLRQEDYHKFQNSLSYIVSIRSARTT